VFGENGVRIADIAKAYNIDAYVSRNISITRELPVLYDVIIDPNQKIYPKVEFGNSLENMYPYRDDIPHHMIIPTVDVLGRSGWVMK
jgi:hypothetical protein